MGRPTVFDIYEDVGYTGYILRVTYADGSEVFGRTARAPFASEYPSANWPMLAGDGNLYEIQFAYDSGDSTCTGNLVRWGTEWGGADPSGATIVCTVTMPGEESFAAGTGTFLAPFEHSVVGLFTPSGVSDVAVLRPGLSASVLVGSATPGIWQAYADGAVLWVGDTSAGLTTVGALI